MKKRVEVFGKRLEAILTELDTRKHARRFLPSAFPVIRHDGTK